MSESNAAAAPSRLSHNHRHPFVRAVLIGWMPHVGKTGVMLVLSWAAPFIIMAIGYAAYRWLPMRWPNLEPLDVWPWVSLQLVLVLLWLIYEIWFTTHRNTSGRQLQADAAGDIIVAFMLVGYIGHLYGPGLQEPWWFWAPCAGAIVDVFQSTLLGINNALEKPFVSTKGSS